MYLYLVWLRLQALQIANQTLRLQVAALRQEFQHVHGAPFPPGQQDGDGHGDQDQGDDESDGRPSTVALFKMS